MVAIQHPQMMDDDPYLFEGLQQHASLNIVHPPDRTDAELLKKRTETCDHAESTGNTG